MADSYPNLDRVLKGTIVADYFAELRKLDMWIYGLGIGGLITFWNRDTYWISLLVFAGAFALSHVVGGFRRKDFSFAAMMLEASKEALPRRMRALLKKGRLQDQLSEDVMEALEQCAKSSWEPQVFLVEARMLKTGVSSSYVKAQREAAKAADALMRQALHTVHRSMTFRTETSDAEIRRLNDLRDDLRSLADESRALSDLSEKAEDSTELQNSLEHFRALKDAIEEVKADTDSG